MQAVQWNLVAGLLRRLPAGVVSPVYPLAPEHSWREGIAAAERAYSAAVEEVGAGNVIGWPSATRTCCTGTTRR